MPEQTHFSLMGELLDPDIPPDEQVAALLNHADKEFSLTGGEPRQTASRPQV
jgi:hypothetical protein